MAKQVIYDEDGDPEEIDSEDGESEEKESNSESDSKEEKECTDPNEAEVSQVSNEELYIDTSDDDYSLVIDEKFKVNDLYDLIGFIQSIPEKDFSKFVREKKRTITDWLKQMHGDEAFITSLFSQESKKDIEQKLKNKIKELEDLEREAKEFSAQIKKEKSTKSPKQTKVGKK